MKYNDRFYIKTPNIEHSVIYFDVKFFSNRLKFSTDYKISTYH